MKNKLQKLILSSIIPLSLVSCGRAVVGKEVSEGYEDNIKVASIETVKISNSIEDATAMPIIGSNSSMDIKISIENTGDKLASGGTISYNIVDSSGSKVTNSVTKLRYSFYENVYPGDIFTDTISITSNRVGGYMFSTLESYTFTDIEVDSASYYKDGIIYSTNDDTIRITNSRIKFVKTTAESNPRYLYRIDFNCDYTISDKDAKKDYSLSYPVCNIKVNGKQGELENTNSTIETMAEASFAYVYFEDELDLTSPTIDISMKAMMTKPNRNAYQDASKVLLGVFIALPATAILATIVFFAIYFIVKANKKKRLAKENTKPEETK